MRTEFDVSLVVASQQLSLSELTALLERPPQSGSHDKGAQHPSGKTWRTTIWRQNANDSTAPYEVQCAQVLNELPPKCAELCRTESDIAVSLNVAVFFQTAYTSLVIPPTLINALAARNIGMEITTYPCSDAEESTDQFAAALAKNDAANADDPNRVVADGVEQSKEIVYSKRMSDWLAKLDPNASEAIRIAAHGQHICRWTIPRVDFPMDRAGYHRWRSTCQKMHAEKLSDIMRDCGYDDESVARVQSLVRKERMKLDPESQLLEDVVCLVFLENYFADFAKDHDEAKLIDIVRKTWKKMSSQGHAAAMTLALDEESKRIVGMALAGG